MRTEQITTLEKTIDYHTRMASSWSSKQALAEHAGNDDDVEKCARQRQSHLEAADAIRSAVRSLKRKASSQTFTPPTVEEVFAFSQQHSDIAGRWPLPDIKAWWNHFQSNGWLVSGKAKMKDWKAAALNGFKRWKEEHPQAATAGTAKAGDPDGWRKFLAVRRRPYVEFRFAPDQLKSDFRKQA